MFNLIINRKVKKFAKKSNYVDAKYIGRWKEYKVYEPYMFKHKAAFTGLPMVILVNKKNEIRWSTPEEAMDTLGGEFKGKYYFITKLFKK